MVRTDWLERQALYRPDAVALEWVPSGDVYTYADCDRIGRTLARRLHDEMGLRPGDRLGILAKNTVEHVLLFIAAQKAGFILVPFNYRLALPELQYIVTDSDPALVFYTEEYAADALKLKTDARRVPLEDVREWTHGADQMDIPVAAPEWDDPLMILYTSGTTGRPKGVMLSHENISSNAITSVGDLEDFEGAFTY